MIVTEWDAGQLNFDGPTWRFKEMKPGWGDSLDSGGYVPQIHISCCTPVLCSIVCKSSCPSYSPSFLRKFLQLPPFSQDPCWKVFFYASMAPRFYLPLGVATMCWNALFVCVSHQPEVLRRQELRLVHCLFLCFTPLSTLRVSNCALVSFSFYPKGVWVHSWLAS